MGVKQRTGGQNVTFFSTFGIQRDLDEAILTVALTQKTLHGIDFSLEKRD
jgi:hypothetical protein